MKIKEALQMNGVKGTSPLAGCGAEPHGLWLLEKATGMTTTQLRLADENTVLEIEAERQFRHMIEQRDNGVPLQYILGEWDFMGIPIKCRPGVLIPRRDTEVLAEEAISFLKNKDKPVALDLCTGSGCVAIAIAGFCVHVTAADICREALELAQENAELNGCQISLIESDLFENITGRFNCITANPPYIPADTIKTLSPEVRQEPEKALNGGPDGLDFYRAIIPQSKEYLTPGGGLFLEIGNTQGKEVKEIMHSNGFKAVVTVKDFEDRDRVVRGVYNVR